MQLDRYERDLLGCSYANYDKLLRKKLSSAIEYIASGSTAIPMEFAVYLCVLLVTFFHKSLSNLSLDIFCSHFYAIRRYIFAKCAS